MRRGNATTLQDVAREAGVAAMTVSVVVNGSRSATRVSDATRERILDAARRLSYRPNAAARGLVQRRMETIGVVGQIETTDVNVYFIEVLTGVLEAATRLEQNTTVFTVSNWTTDEDRILRFCDGRVDGLILVAPINMNPEFSERLLRYTPFVMLHSNSVPANIDDLDVDNEGGSYAAVRHLTELGHRRIAHFAADLALEGPRLRLAGYRRALEDAGIAYDDRLVFHGSFSEKSGRSRVHRLLELTEADRPTAIACVNDEVACACIDELAKAGFTVPGDFSITGFDDAPMARMTQPPLTTIRQPLRNMGRYAVERLRFRIEEGERINTNARIAEKDSTTEPPQAKIAQPHIEIFPFELIVRGSTGPIQPT